jgi:surfactin synthase thioesterase subunit
MTDPPVTLITGGGSRSDGSFVKPRRTRMSEGWQRTSLVCLPFAGAGASFYRPWSAFAGDGLEIIPMQLPGRERRIDVEPFRDVHEAADAMEAELIGELGLAGRVALFGHSLGAVLAYELAHRLCGIPRVEVVRLFASGSPQPNVQRPNRATGLPDGEFLLRVKEFAGYSHEALEDPEMLELILPTLRADVQMHENYVPSMNLPLPAPITALRGVTDELVSSDDAAGWAKVTSKDFELAELPGGHMYLTEGAEPLLRLIRGSA